MPWDPEGWFLVCEDEVFLISFLSFSRDVKTDWVLLLTTTVFCWNMSLKVKNVLFSENSDFYVFYESVSITSLRVVHYRI